MSEPTHIFRWDLDKTYLRTDFDTLRGLWRSAFEKAEAKQAVPGAAVLLRELRAAGAHRICFISGSPRQMRKVLEQKLHLDGVQFDEFILKPNISNLLRGRFRALREQVGYKLPALLAGRVGVAPGVPETLFGDDAEGDAFIYSIYADILRGRVTRETVAQVLEKAGAYPDVATRTLGLFDSLAPRPEDGSAADRPAIVRRIFIHLDKRSPPARFDRFGARVVPFFNYFQAAAVLYHDRVLSAAALARVGVDMVRRSGYELDALCNSYQDVVRRGRIGRDTTQRLGAEVESAAPLVPDAENGPDVHAIVAAFGRRIRALGNAKAELFSPPEPDIDYLTALDEDPPRRRKQKKGKREAAEGQ